MGARCLAPPSAGKIHRLLATGRVRVRPLTPRETWATASKEAARAVVAMCGGGAPACSATPLASGGLGGGGDAGTAGDGGGGGGWYGGPSLGLCGGRCGGGGGALGGGTGGTSREGSFIGGYEWGWGQWGVVAAVVGLLCFRCAGGVVLGDTLEDSSAAVTGRLAAFQAAFQIWKRRSRVEVFHSIGRLCQRTDQARWSASLSSRSLVTRPNTI